MEFLLDNWMLFGLAVASGTWLVWSLIADRSGLPRLSPAQTVSLINQKDAVVVDLRSAEAFAKGHVAGAVNLPPASLDTAATVLRKVAKKPLVLCCENGITAPRSGRRLAAAGDYQLHVLQGGLAAWREANLPLVR